MTERKETLSSRTDAAKQFARDKRDLTAKESEAARVASDSAKTAQLRELRLGKEAAEHEANGTAKPAKPPRK
jgi:hypothetical protein